MSGLDEGLELIAQALDESQPPYDPVLRTSQSPGDALGGEPFGLGQVGDQDRFLIEVDGAPAAVELEHQALGLFDRSLMDDDRHGGDPLCLQGPQTLEAIDQF